MRNTTLLNDNFGLVGKAGKKLLSTTALATAGLLALSTGAQAQSIDPLTIPQGGEVVGGSADINSPQDGVLNINQHTDRTVINWNSFNIGVDALTQFFQPNSGSLAVNRVTGDHADPTLILGTLRANGRVMVLDRNGVIFGQNSVIDVGGIIASTGDIDTAAVMNGSNTLELSNFSESSSIINSGTITVADAGIAAFVSPTVINNGIINAKL